MYKKKGIKNRNMEDKECVVKTDFWLVRTEVVCEDPIVFVPCFGKTWGILKIGRKTKMKSLTAACSQYHVNSFKK